MGLVMWPWIMSSISSNVLIEMTAFHVNWCGGRSSAKKARKSSSGSFVQKSCAAITNRAKSTWGCDGADRHKENERTNERTNERKKGSDGSGGDVWLVGFVVRVVGLLSLFVRV